MVPRQPKTLTSYSKTQKLQNTVYLLLCPLIVPTCCHTTAMILTQATTLTTIVAPQSAAVLIAALAVICTAMTITMMINTITDPVVFMWIAIMLSTIMCIFQENPTLTSWDVNLSVCNTNFLKSCHILMALITLPGTLIQIRSF